MFLILILLLLVILKPEFPDLNLDLRPGVEGWRLILEYIRVLVWPSMATVLIIIFRRNVAALIDRIRVISGPGGAKIEVGPPEQSTNMTDIGALEHDPLLEQKTREIEAT